MLAPTWGAALSAPRKSFGMTRALAPKGSPRKRVIKQVAAAALRRGVWPLLLLQ